jgi:hypothetical protein
LFRVDSKLSLSSSELKDNLPSALFDAGMEYAGASSELMTEAGRDVVDPNTNGIECLRHDDDSVLVVKVKLKAGTSTVVATYPKKGTKVLLEDVAKDGMSVQIAITAYFTAKHEGLVDGDYVNPSGNCTFTVCSCAVLKKDGTTPWEGGSPTTKTVSSYAAVKAAVDAETGRVTPDSDDEDDQGQTPRQAESAEVSEALQTSMSQMMQQNSASGSASGSPKRPAAAKGRSGKSKKQKKSSKQ